MITTKIAPSTLRYITVSQIAKLNKGTAKVIDALFNSDLDVSFGDASYTLVAIPQFLDMLVDALDQQEMFYQEDNTINTDYIDIKNMLEKFDGDVYIDLEN